MIHRYVSSPTRNETVPCLSIRSHQMEKQLYGKRKPFLRENFLIISMERAIKLDWQNYQELFESIIYRMQILSSLFFLVISLISLTRFFVSNFKVGRSTFDFNCSRIYSCRTWHLQRCATWWFVIWTSIIKMDPPDSKYIYIYTWTMLPFPLDFSKLLQ